MRIIVDPGIPASLQYANELLTAYGEWAKDRARVARCYSAEGRYKSPQDDIDRQPRPEYIPDFSATDIHRVIIRVPAKERTVLFAWYVPQRMPFDMQMRKLGLSRKFALEYRNKGLQMFENIRKVLVTKHRV